MNYNAENRTPRDRVGEELFSPAGDISAQRYGTRDIKPVSAFAPFPAAVNTGARVSSREASHTRCPLGGCGQRRNCGCAAGNTGRRSAGASGNRCRVHGEDQLAGLPLAMAYVPMQEWRNLFDLENGFDEGTLFKELDFPFYPTSCPRKGCR